VTTDDFEPQVTAGHRRSQADLRAKSSDHQIGATIGAALDHVAAVKA
jgi:hypothetical protein